MVIDIDSVYKNKEKLDEKYTCECGSICLKRQKLRHEKTQKHIKSQQIL
jgi:hypothetical protein